MCDESLTSINTALATALPDRLRTYLQTLKTWRELGEALPHEEDVYLGRLEHIWHEMDEAERSHLASIVTINSSG